MSDWRIVNKEKDPIEAVTEALSLGFAEGFYVFTFEHRESGERREVIAYDEDEAGEKIERGDFWR
jgi:hypothetical protein